MNPETRMEPGTECLVKQVREFSESCRAFAALLDKLTDELREANERRKARVDNPPTRC